MRFDIHINADAEHIIFTERSVGGANNKNIIIKGDEITGVIELLTGARADFSSALGEHIDAKATRLIQLRKDIKGG